MSDKLYEEREKIHEILDNSNRLKFLLLERYKVLPDDIKSIRVDSDNFKIDINFENEMFRFKAKGTQNVLMHDPDQGIMTMVFDPALVMGIMEICEDFS